MLSARARSRLVPLSLLLVATLGMGTDAASAAGAAGRQSPQDDEAMVLHRPVLYDDLRALRAFFERVDVTSVASGVSSPPAAGSLTFDAVLARLPADPDAAFRFVQRSIRYVPYAGSVRGAAGTLESGAGNALDQALLLQSLLRAGGTPARLVRGSLDWEEAARLVLGTTATGASRPDDPWPRWVEAAADHWWVQAQRDGEWIDLDPTFPGSDVGSVAGGAGEPVDELPSRLRTEVDVELRRGGQVVASATLPAEAIIGSTVHLAFRSESAAAAELLRRGEETLARQSRVFRHLGQALGWLPIPVRRPPVPAVEGGQSTVPVRLVVPPPLPRPSPLRRLFLDAAAGPWTARLTLPGRLLEAGPFEPADVDNLLVRVTTRAPQTAPHVFDAAWSGGPEGRLVIVVAAGAISVERLVSLARDRYRSLNRIAAAEQAARVDMRPPINYFNAAESLGAVARAEWEDFARGGTETLAWSLLHGVERVSSGSSAGRVIRPGLRLAAVRWRPPNAAATGALEVLMSDLFTVGQLTGDISAASLRAAQGVLQSAVFSQVLNRITDRAPDTAFDMTLRAIGTGQALRAFEDAEELPAEWSPAARAEATTDLSAGYRLLAPSSLGETDPGWWAVGIADGQTIGWIPASQTALLGRVDIGTEGSFDDLDALLASLPAMHRALRWLSELPGSGPTSLSSVPMLACQSAAVAATAMGRSMPPGWPRPDAGALCGSR